LVQKIKWTLRALNDLNNIYEFIAKDSKRYAHRSKTFTMLSQTLPGFH